MSEHEDGDGADGISDTEPFCSCGESNNLEWHTDQAGDEFLRCRAGYGCRSDEFTEAELRGRRQEMGCGPPRLPSVLAIAAEAKALGLFAEILGDAIRLVRAEQRSKGLKTGSWRCGRCGCTDARACPGGCFWVGKDMCSACVEVGPGGKLRLKGPGLARGKPLERKTELRRKTPLRRTRRSP